MQHAFSARHESQQAFSSRPQTSITDPPSICTGQNRSRSRNGQRRKRHRRQRAQLRTPRRHTARRTAWGGIGGGGRARAGTRIQPAAMAAATLHVLVELETMAGVSMVTATEGKTILTTMPSKGCYREPTRTWVRLHQCTNRPAILVRSSKEGEGVRVGDDGDVDAYNTVRDVQHSAITTPLRRERCHAQHHDGTGIAATIAARSPTHLTCLRGAVASLSSSGSCYFFSEFSCESSCYARSIHEGARPR